MSNRIDKLFAEKKRNILSVYFTAGYPKLDDTMLFLESLQKSGADLVEIGMPFSDPLADGPVIQESSMVALRNGMSIATLFNQLRYMRNGISIPVLLMGYVNPIMQYGIEKFLKDAADIGVDGVIIPDLPPAEYVDAYQQIFEKYGLYNILLITPQTSESRMFEIDKISRGFLYMVSTASITGNKDGTADSQLEYFNKVNALGLKNPRLIGFGIKDKSSFDKACKYASGAIIGTSFVKAMSGEGTVFDRTRRFIHTIIYG